MFNFRVKTRSETILSRSINILFLTFYQFQGIRSAYNLYDKKKHQQCFPFRDEGSKSFNKYGAINAFPNSLSLSNNNIFRKHCHVKEISKEELAQLSTSLFLFTHSMNNNNLAKQLLRGVDLRNVNSTTELLCKIMERKNDDLCNDTISIGSKFEFNLMRSEEFHFLNSQLNLLFFRC